MSPVLGELVLIGLTVALADALLVLDGQRRWAVVCGDCTVALEFVQHADVCLQDPPYSEHVHGKQRRILSAAGSKAASEDGKGHAVRVADLGFDAITTETMERVADLLADRVQRWCLTFCDAESAHRWQSEFAVAGLEHVRIGAWIKLCGQPQLSGDRPAVGFEAVHIAHRKGRKHWNGGGHPAVWSHMIATDRNGTGDRVHTTQKPLPLMLDLVSDFHGGGRGDPGPLRGIRDHRGRVPPPGPAVHWHRA